MITAKMADGLLCLETTEEMESELTKVIDDLDRAMNHTALSVTRRNGKHSSFQSGNSSFSVVFV